MDSDSERMDTLEDEFVLLFLPRIARGRRR